MADREMALHFGVKRAEVLVLCGGKGGEAGRSLGDVPYHVSPAVTIYRGVEHETLQKVRHRPR